MKKQQLLTIVIGCIISFNNWGQQVPTPHNTPNANNPNQAVNTANSAWYRGGNNLIGPAGSSNIFGTKWNSPIYTMTNNQVRSVLMGNYTDNYLGTGYLHDVSGFMGIGLNNYFVNHVPLTMLHLEGPNNTSFIGGQWRNWIRQWADT